MPQPKSHEKRPRAAEDGLVNLLQSVRPKLARVASRYRIPTEDAEDLLQQTLLAFVQKRPTIDSPEAWLVGAFKRECLLYLRTRQRRLYDAIDSTLLESVCQPSPAAQDRDQLIRDLDRAISRTPAKCRPLLRMRYSLGFASKEIAAELGYRVTSVRKIASRCLAALSRQVVAR